MKISEIIKLSNEKLKNIEYVDPTREAIEIISHVLLVNENEILLSNDLEINDNDLDEIKDLIELRSSGEPLQYVLNRAYFYNRKFYIDNRALIPRYDTEHILYRTLEVSKDFKNPDILEVGAGSGAISITLNLELENARIDACDISNDALEVCNINQELHNSDVNFFYSDLFGNVVKKYDIIISNPPYIKKSDLSLIPKETLKEPLNALDGGEDGLDFYKEITKESIDYLKDGGYLIYEIGFDEVYDVYEIMNKYGFKNINIDKDFQNLDRVIYGKKG